MLVWALTWAGQACPPLEGAPGASTPSPAAAQPTRAADCEQLTLVDATTGAYIYSLQY